MFKVEIFKLTILFTMLYMIINKHRSQSILMDLNDNISKQRCHRYKIIFIITNLAEYK